jgi:hypothetical protein
VREGLEGVRVEEDEHLPRELVRDGVGALDDAPREVDALNAREEAARGVLVEFARDDPTSARNIRWRGGGILGGGGVLLRLPRDGFFGALLWAAPSTETRRLPSRLRPGRRDGFGETVLGVLAL